MDKGQKIALVMFIIRIVIAVLFLTLNFVWMFPIMNNSKKDEPSIETRYSLISYYNRKSKTNFRFLEYSDVKCDDVLPDFLEKGVYETFNIKMSKVYKFSKAYIIILFIQLGIIVLAIVILFITGIAFIYTCIDGIISLINLIFFIILSVYYKKGEYDDLEEFGGCYFFKKDEFMDVYEYIFKMDKNFKKAFIFNIVFISLRCCLNFTLSICGGSGKKS